VGTGTIGAAWAACFLSRGIEVFATDPNPAAGAHLEKAIDAAWPKLAAIGLPSEADRSQLRFTSDMTEAVSGADFIQESAPDNEDLKIELIGQISESCPIDSVIASSSSTFLPSRLASRCRNPERIIVGHPFVPVYLIPLVEVVGGAQTSPDVLDWAAGFYDRLGKAPLRLKTEIEGYIANRLQRVVFEEALALVANGICDYDDIDKAVTLGPGLRWAIQGPILHRHLGGGKGGVRHMIDHFGWDGEAGGEHQFIEAIHDRWGHTTIDELEDWRDDNLVTMLKHLRSAPEAKN
jgi:3-hydroxyacyl-CoA dehydrogenase